VNPWWVITLLADEGELSNRKFVETLDAQLKGWSTVNDVGERWWAADMFTGAPTSDPGEFTGALSGFLNSPLDAVGDGGPRIMAGAGPLQVALVGDLRAARTRSYLHCLAKLLRLQELRLLQGSAAFHDTTLEIHALLYLPMKLSRELWEDTYRFLTQLHTMMSDRPSARLPFNTVIIFQEKNQDGENENGYTSLTDDQVREMMAQSLFHQMASRSAFIGELKDRYNTDYLAMGSASVFYDWKAAQGRLASALGTQLLAAFVSAAEEPFVDSNNAQEVARDVMGVASVRTLYENMTNGPNRPALAFDARLWGGARDRNGREVSPWALHSKLLLTTYFLTFLKYMPFHISDYARVFIHAGMQRLQEFMRVRQEEVWTGKNGLRGTIRQAIVRVLKPGSGSRTLAQVALVADEIKKVYDPARLSSQLPALEDASALDIFTVPKFLEPYYVAAQDRLDAGDEELMYQRLVDSVRAHPMPTALFLEATLIGFLLSLVGSRLMAMLSPQIVNLESLLAYPRLTHLFLFLLPIAAGLWRYHFKTLRYLRKQLYTYAASVLRHAQTLAREAAARELAVIFGRAQSYCDEIKTWADRLNRELTYPAVRSDESYSSTTFRREVFQGFEIPGREARPGESTVRAQPYLLEVRNAQKPFERFDELDKYTYLQRALNEQTDGSALWEVISAAIPPSVSDGTAEEIGRRWRGFAEGIYGDMSGRQLDSLLGGDTVALMNGLSFPPLGISSGTVKLPVSAEWRYGKPERLAPLVGQAETAEMPGTSLASLAMYRPVGSLNDIAILRTVVENMSDEPQDWRDLSTAFTLATMKAAGGERPGLENFFDQQLITVKALGAEIADLQSRLGMRDPTPLKRGGSAAEGETGPGAPDPELEV
jgi:hypothetical protein